MKKINFEKILITFLMTVFSLHIFILDIENIEINNVSNKFEQFIKSLYYSINPINLKTLIIFTILFFGFYKINLNKSKKNKFTNLMNIILTILTLIGLAYNSQGSTLAILFCTPTQIYKTIALFLGYYIVYSAIIELIKTIDISKINLKKTLIEKKFEKHPILITSLILIIFILPFAIIFYPGASNGDTADSIFQFFHSDNSWSASTINLIDEDIYINKHHSVLFTVILGNFLKIGNNLQTYNFGFFLFILFQITIVISIFTFMIYYMKKIKIPFYLILFSILFLIFSPIVIKYSIKAVKDTLSSSFTLLYVIFLLQIIRDYNSIFKNKFRLISLIIVMLLVMMFRNNGIFTIIFSFPFLFIFYKKKWKRLSKVFISVLIIFFMYNNILLPTFGISNGSIKEVLSIPFMQIARVVTYHQEDFSKKEINSIDKILDFEVLTTEYNPNISDGIKNTYKKTATQKELIVFFEIWFKYLKKYPFLYIESFLDSTYGYFYPAYQQDDPTIVFNHLLQNEKELNLKPSDYFDKEKITINYFLIASLNNPFYVWFNNTAIFDLILIFSVIYIFRKKQYKYLIPLTPLLSVLLVCLASPVNGCIRYILPIVFTMPIIISIDYIIYRDNPKINFKK